MKKSIKILACLLLVVVVAVAVVWWGELRSMCSVKAVDGNEYLYTMEYHAHYDLDDVVASDLDDNGKLLSYVVRHLAKGLPVKMNPSKVKSQSFNANCTSFQARQADGTGYWYGRNYDFFKNPTLVVTSHPRKGYASLAVCDMAHFGYSLDKLPKRFKDKVLCLASIYAPMDGINEKGLCTSIMALPKQPARQNTGKHCAGTSILMRLFLDRCATVDEALALLDSVDVRHDIQAGSGYHYMVADAQGNCAVIEFDRNDGWKTMITRKADSVGYMHVTNHLLDPKYYTEEPNILVGNPHSRSWWRYSTVAAYLSAHGEGLTLAQAQECLAQVHWENLRWPTGLVEDTQYSNVYDQENLTLSLRNWNDYGSTHTFRLE